MSLNSLTVEDQHEEVKYVIDNWSVNYFEALKIYEAYSDEFQKVPMVYVNIGIVYKKQKEYETLVEA